MPSSSGETTDFYRVLGLERGASTEEIRKSFQQLAKELHPDTNSDTASAAQFQAVKEAYDVLRTDSKRKAYDAQLNRRYGAPADPFEAERLRRRAEAFNQQYRPHGPSNQTRAMRVVEQLLRPRVIFAVPFVALVGSNTSPGLGFALQTTNRSLCTDQPIYMLRACLPAG